MKKLVDFTLTDIIQKKVSFSFFNETQEYLPIYFQLLELIKKQPNLLCTISGGQDSILTFFILLHIYKKDSLQILYCHHLWQIKNFFSAKFVFHVSYLIQIPYTLILPQNLVLTENEARNWRKKNFCRFSQLAHIPFSVTGHTETDTLEKTFNNILRGTSSAGFSSSEFLQSQNKVNLFFSSLNLNTCFALRKPKVFGDHFEKPKNFSQNVVFLSNSLSLTLSQIQRIQSFENIDFDKTRTKHVEKFQHLFPREKVGLGSGVSSKIDFLSKNQFSRKKTQNKKALIFLKNRLSKSDQKLIFIKTSFLKSTTLETSYSQRKNFKFSKPHKKKKVFSLIVAPQPFVSSITRFDEQKSLLNQYDLFNGSKKHLLTDTKKILPAKPEIIFNFYSSNDFLVKKQNYQNLKHQKSGSFCFSNNYFTMQEELLKPLEKTPRFSVSKFVKLYDLPTVIDVTNFSSAFLRNKVRHQLVPFLRCLVHLNIEYLLTNLFNLIDQEHKDQEKQIYEVYFLSTLLKILFTKKITKSSSQTLFQRSHVFNILEHKSPKRLMQIVSANQARSFSQKLFREYKNLNLNFLQIVKFHDFY